MHLETVNFLKVKQNQLLEDLADWESKCEPPSNDVPRLRIPDVCFESG